jgi:hypothetical protein
MDLEKKYHKKNEQNPFKICQDYIDDPRSVYLLGKNWKDKFTLTLRSMFDAIQVLEKEEKLDNFIFTPVEEGLNFLSAITIEQPLTEDLCIFIKNFIFIAFNLNENLQKYEPVKRKITYLQRYCENALTLSEYMANLKNITGRVGRWKNWTPPSFRLSGHYYNLLKED